MKATIRRSATRDRALTFLVRLGLAAVMVMGCNKDPGPGDPGPVSAASLLTAAPWKITRITGPASEDLTSRVPMTRMVFSADGGYDVIYAKGQWEFANHETQIILDKGLVSESVCNVTLLTQTALTLGFQKSPTGLPTPFSVQMVTAPAIDRTPAANFEALWSEFDARYSFFLVKNINWDSLHAAFASRVTASTTDAQLFGILSALLDNLRDGHVNVISPIGRYNYLVTHSAYHLNFLGLGVVGGYTVAGLHSYASGALAFGRIGTDIGYLYVGPNFAGDPVAWGAGIDAVMDSCALLSRMIVDVRGNSGGNDQLATIVAGRFMDQARLFSYVEVRTGPKHTDMSAPAGLSVGPLGAKRFSGRVALLTNRQCFSSAEEFILMMKVRPNVTVLGDRTGGGSGNPITLELPNSWQFSVSRWVMYTSGMEYFEEVGLAPDVPVAITPADSVAGHDTVLEEAMARLRL